MKYYAPEYYSSFHCLAGDCKHTCCVGWEIDVDETALPRFLADEEIASRIGISEPPHFILEEGEKCPFLRQDGLCRMIIDHGEDFLCQICRDHPRFRNYWTGREEIGLGLVCEEAARLILFSPVPMKLQMISDDGTEEELPEDEQWLWDLREELWSRIPEEGAMSRLKEYLIYRHLSNALYDGMVEERIRFIDESCREIAEKWNAAGGTPDALIETVRVWSYDVEYDDEAIDEKLETYRRESEKAGDGL